MPGHAFIVHHVIEDIRDLIAPCLIVRQQQINVLVCLVVLLVSQLLQRREHLRGVIVYIVPVDDQVLICQVVAVIQECGTLRILLQVPAQVQVLVVIGRLHHVLVYQAALELQLADEVAVQALARRIIMPETFKSANAIRCRSRF